MNETQTKVPAEEFAKLPALNWGALFMPAIWGPAHGFWVTILFYPLWIFADGCFLNAFFYGGVTWLPAALVFLGTAAFTLFFARTAGPRAYLRVAHKTTLQEYFKRERAWAVASALIALLFMGFATWYNLTVRIPSGFL